MPQNINLIDPALLPARQRLSPPQMLAVLGVAAAAVLGHWGWEQMRLTHALASAAPAATPESAPADPAQADSTAREHVAQREALRDLLRSQVSSTEGSAPLIAAVVRALPASVWLTELQLGPQHKLRISGGTLDTAGFGQLSAALNQQAALRGLPLQVVRLEPQAALAASDADSAPAAPAAHLFVLEAAPEARP